MSIRKICIVNGDDFGASDGINRGIIEAFTNGILTSASLMINMPRAEEAIAMSAEHSGLSVGLHVNFTNETDPVIDVNDTQAAKTELYRQLQLFEDRFGHPPSHLDSHHNVHRMSNLTPLFIEVAERYTLPLREHSPARYYSNFYGRWDGESHPEHISASQLVHVLETEVGSGLTELACHPGYVTDDFHSEYSIERELELRSLCDPKVRQRVSELNIELLNFIEARNLLERLATNDSGT